MVRRASRIVQTVRDAILLVLSLVLVSTDIGPGKELSNLLLAGISATIFILTVVNIILNALKVKRKGYFLGNSIVQLLIGFFPLLGLFPPLGIILIVFNLAVLFTLREKKTVEKGMKFPPRPITRKFRSLVGAGLLVMFAGISVSWLATTNFPLIGFYLRTADLSSVAKLVSNTFAQIFGFLALVISPISLVAGLIGLFKRRFAFVSGILAITVGTGWIVSTATLAGIGPYVFICGGAIVLAASIGAK
jgi:hypothetical protein